MDTWITALLRVQHLLQNIKNLDWTMVGHRSFGQQLLYPSTFSILYGWEIKQAIMSMQFFRATTMWFVVRKRSKHRIQSPRSSTLWYVDSITWRTFQCALIAQKYDQIVRFGIQSKMLKNYMWKFLLLSSITKTPVIIKIWRRILVLEPSILRFGKWFEVCITCDKVLSNDWTAFTI
jgi:hypothetical protein